MRLSSALVFVAKKLAKRREGKTEGAISLWKRSRTESALWKVLGGDDVTTRRAARGNAEAAARRSAAYMAISVVEGSRDAGKGLVLGFWVLSALGSLNLL